MSSWQGNIIIIGCHPSKTGQVLLSLIIIVCIRRNHKNWSLPTAFCQLPTSLIEASID
jgi:hypothetical protein